MSMISVIIILIVYFYIIFTIKYNRVIINCDIYRLHTVKKMSSEQCVGTALSDRNLKHIT